MPITTRQIQNYYEQNTRLFLRFGSSQQVQSIHRALWLNAQNLEDALNTSNQMVLEVARQIDAQKIADLGCGVGATLFNLLSHFPPTVSGVGLTISMTQADWARRAARTLSIQNAQIIQGDFQFLPLSAGFDLIYSIEAFVHAVEPERYLREAARILRPGGKLLILDDFRGKNPTSTWLDLYQRGWHAPNLRPTAQIIELAAQNSLQLAQNRDLTPYLKLRALPDPLAHSLSAVFSPLWQLHPIIPSMLGSMALQQCLRSGTVEYRWLEFEKV
jgi:ubiquinone/menaquinone biosynthesis C-methylase UbiE